MSLDAYAAPLKLMIAIGIATCGRRDILSETLRVLTAQKRYPDKVFICPAAADDIDHATLLSLPFETQVVASKLGLTIQRNAILEVTQDYDVIAFLDDDFVAHPGFIEEMSRCFTSRAEVVAMSGLVLKDGVKGPGLSMTDAARALSAHRDEDADERLEAQYNAYGCNMCIRLDPVRAGGLRFDEHLPLYGWLEDVDFCRRLSHYGTIVKNHRMVGVHLGAKSGRTSGVRFGYSQVANPLYIWGKGSTSFSWAVRHIVKNMMANLRGLVFPEPWIDRRGRVSGNLLAIRDLFCGRLKPTRILTLS